MNDSDVSGALTSPVAPRCFARPPGRRQTSLLGGGYGAGRRPGDLRRHRRRHVALWRRGGRGHRGDIVTSTLTNAFRNLFFGFPKSYGSLGFALRLVLRILPVEPCMRVEHIPFETAAGIFAAVAEACEGDPDFVDGVVFSPGTFVLNVARFEEVGGPLSRYDFEQIYYRSLLERPVDHLSVQDYLWRWDTDWFWCSKNFGAQNPVVCRLFGRSHLNSKTYSRLLRMSARLRYDPKRQAPRPYDKCVMGR